MCQYQLGLEEIRWKLRRPVKGAAGVSSSIAGLVLFLTGWCK
jgi:hypothetical protein